MASASFVEDLTCSICLAIFTDPVSLLCGHSFCRECVTQSLSKKSQCPQCQTTVPTEEKYLPTTLILKSLATKAKETEKKKKELGIETTRVSDWLCLEHEEKLKLFCETDQQLACVICRDGEKHDGHAFKPIKEAAKSLRRELEKATENLPADIQAIECLAKTQNEEIRKTQEASHHLMSQISTQFEEMNQFLKKREDEMKKELQEKEREAVKKMSENLKAMELALSESREIEVRVRSALDITDPEKFLHSWTEGKTMTTTPESPFRSRASELQVTSASVSLGPYESHLQFFVWKELLHMIKPLPERLTLKRENSNLTVSHDGRSLFYTPQTYQWHTTTPFGTVPKTSLGQFNNVSTTNAFGEVSTAPKFGTVSTAPKFGTVSTTSVFGAVSTTSAFGAVSTTSAFCAVSATPAFGAVSAAPAFGAVSAAPAFGAVSTTPKFGAVSASPAFGAVSTTPKLGFGSAPRTFHQNRQRNYINHTKSCNEFTTGQYYWEIDVGMGTFWELGITNNYLKYDGHRYIICNDNTNTQLTFKSTLRKIGIYLNCSSKELSFYNADDMKHVHSIISKSMSMPLSAYFRVGYGDAMDFNPLTVCWY